jgi:hypothetical protein
LAAASKATKKLRVLAIVPFGVIFFLAFFVFLPRVCGFTFSSLAAYFTPKEDYLWNISNIHHWTMYTNTNSAPSASSSTAYLVDGVAHAATSRQESNGERTHSSISNSHQSRQDDSSYESAKSHMNALITCRQQQLASIAFNSALAYTNSKRAQQEKVQETPPEVEQTHQQASQMKMSSSFLSSCDQKTPTTHVSSSIKNVSESSQTAKTNELIDNVRSLSKDPLVQRSLLRAMQLKGGLSSSPQEPENKAPSPVKAPAANPPAPAPLFGNVSSDDYVEALKRSIVLSSFRPAEGQQVAPTYQSQVQHASLATLLLQSALAKAQQQRRAQLLERCGPPLFQSQRASALQPDDTSILKDMQSGAPIGDTKVIVNLLFLTLLLSLTIVWCQSSQRKNWPGTRFLLT